MPAFDKRIRDFEAANTQVLGISTDSPFSHENWAKSVGITNYPLLSDVHRTVARDYGVLIKEWRLLQRAVFVIGRDNRIAYADYVADQMQEPDYDAAVNAAREAASAP